MDNIDRRSYELGIIDAFAEVVSLGVKKLALSSPLSHEMYECLKEDAREIVRLNGIKSYTEESLVITPLFPGEIALDKYVIMLYKDDSVLDEYKNLKDEIAKDSSARNSVEFARRLGRLLSYPEHVIEDKLESK